MLSATDRFAIRACRAAIWLTTVVACASATADWKDPHEGPQATWRLSEADCGVRILRQQRTFREAHGGSGCENVRLLAGQGTHIYFAYTLGRAPVIAEFAPSLWVKATRPNVQLMARVVLPRSQDPRTGKPLSALVRGDFYTEVGAWQKLFIPEVQKLVQREVVILRSQFGKEVDAREAYIDLIVLNTYCGDGEVDLWIDDLEIAGYVPDADSARGEGAAVGPRLARATTAALQGSLLVINGKPAFPRLIDHQGEPLEYLQSLGFSGVRLSATPTPELLQDARRLGMHLVAPPPPASVRIDETHSPVIAWSLGRRLTGADLDEARETANRLVRIDPQSQRPCAASVESKLDEYSRSAGIIISERAFLGTDLETQDYAFWLKQRAETMRPGTPFWASVDTIPAAPLREQAALLCPHSTPLWEVNPEVLRCQAYTAIAAGARGLVFRSDTPLDDSPTGRLRADVLKLMNQELMLLDPWTSSGRLREELPAPAPARTVVLQAERSRVVLMTHHGPALQYVAGPTTAENAALVIPGTPVTDRPFLITPAGLKELRGSHGSAGLKFTLEQPGLASAVVITQDAPAVTHLFRNTHDARIGVARLQSQLTSYRLATTTAVDRELAALGRPLASADKWLGEAKSYVERSQKLMESGDTEGLHKFLRKAEEGIARVRRGHWEQTAAVFPSPASSPCIAGFTLLPLHWELADRLMKGSWTANQLPGGEMETLDTLLQSGWKQERSEPAGVTADVSLAVNGPHSGSAALRLFAAGQAGATSAGVLERPLVTITSAPIAVKPGQVVRIHGWVHIPQPLTGSREGLWIYDSLAGPSLAERVLQTRGWREFTLYRAAPRSGTMRLNFALMGLGEVLLDDVQVTLLQPEPVREFSARRD